MHSLRQKRMITGAALFPRERNVASPGLDSSTSTFPPMHWCVQFGCYLWPPAYTKCHLFTQSLTFTLTDLWLIDLNTSVQAACFLKLIIPCLSWLLGESLHSQCVSHTHTKVKKKERYRQSQWQTRDLYSLLLLFWEGSLEKKARGGFNTGRPFSFCPIRSARKAHGRSGLDTFSCLFYAIWLGYWHSKPFGTFVSTTTQKPRANHPLKQVLKNFKRE